MLSRLEGGVAIFFAGGMQAVVVYYPFAVDV